MAIKNFGFTGTVNANQVSYILNQSMPLPTVNTTVAFKVTPVAGAQAVSVAPGTATQAFVQVESTTATVLQLPNPSATAVGGWHLIALERKWPTATQPTGSTAIKALPMTGVAQTTRPFKVPFGYADDFDDRVGVLAHQKLAWVWVKSGDPSSMKIFDCRMLAGGFPARLGIDRIFNVSKVGEVPLVAAPTVNAIVENTWTDMPKGTYHVDASIATGSTVDANHTMRLVIRGIGLTDTFVRDQTSGVAAGKVHLTRDAYAFDWPGGDLYISAQTIISAGSPRAYPAGSNITLTLIANTA